MPQHSSDAPNEPPRRSHGRSLTVGEVIEFLEYLAPAAPAGCRPFGLQVGTRHAALKSVVLAPLPTFSAITAAAAHPPSLLVTAAPLITEPRTSLCWDDPIGARISQLAQNQLSLYAISSSYAAAPGGFDDCLAEKLGLAPTGALVAALTEAQFKFVVFVPDSDVTRVHMAASEAGAGAIGHYSHCAFAARGLGMFRPESGARPTAGRVGRQEEVEETRLEMLVSERDLQGVVAAVLDAHPYEEVAYDVYPLRNPGAVYGRGRIGELPLKVSLDTVLAQVDDALELGRDKPARCSHRPGLAINSLAVASGISTGENLLWEAHRQEAGAFVVGGASLADQMLADSANTVLIDVGFGPSVTPGLQRLAAQLRSTFSANALTVTCVG